MGIENFKKLVDEYTVEWDENMKSSPVGVTLEFSTSSENFEEKVDYIMKKRVHRGMWHIFKCDTCKGYHEDRPWHVQIVDSMSWDEQYEESSKLRREHYQMELHAKEVLEQTKGKEFYPKGTLKEFVDLFECLVDNPQQYPEYINASLIGDTANEMVSVVEGCKKYEINREILQKLVDGDERKVLYSESNDVTIDENGYSTWNMFSSMNQGCVAYVDLRNFDSKVGRRLRVTVGLLEDV
ncbi:conserved hypothetical protein [Vibrio phage 277E43-1]|nr:conserved hypothetical protein [Vibrio phage 277E43-1]